MNKTLQKPCKLEIQEKEKTHHLWWALIKLM